MPYHSLLIRAVFYFWGESLVPNTTHLPRSTPPQVSAVKLRVTNRATITTKMIFFIKITSGVQNKYF